jgi:tRNA U38,U39,U40 pseudouridine synthase TruA
VWIEGEAARKETQRAGEEAVDSAFELEGDALSRLSGALSAFEGYHSFHNFTNDVRPAWRSLCLLPPYDEAEPLNS